MKWISECEYKDLCERANNNDYRKSEFKKCEEDLEITKKELKNVKEDHIISLKRKDDEFDQKVYEAQKGNVEKINKLTMEKNSAEKESEILRSAFKNLGFDVKDMKEILNKLVDGIVSKNKIQLVK